MTGIQKFSSVILFIIAGLSLLFAGMYYLGGSYAYNGYQAMNFTSLVLVWAVVLFLIAGVATILFSLVNIISNPKALKGFLISIGLTVALVIISYALASSSALPENIINPDLPTPSESKLKWVGAGLNGTYILALVSFIGIIISEVVRAFK